MGFFNWVGGLFKQGYKGIAGAVDYVVHAFQVLWNIVTQIGRNVGRAWHTFYRSMSTLAKLIDDLAAATYSFGRKLITHTIPDAVRNTLRAAISEAAKLANTVKDWATKAYRAVVSYVSALVADLRSWTSSAVRWLTGLISQIRDTLGRVARIVDALLTHPDRLVAWILGPLWRALLRLLIDSAEAIARYLAGSVVKLILRSVPTIEAIIADIF